MAADEEMTSSPEKLLSTYLGISFAVFLGLLPKAAITHLPSMQARNRALSLKLIQAEEQIRQMRLRRQEDSRANARVVEIFASHRNAWQQEENRLLAQIESATDEIEALRKKIEEMEGDLSRLRKDVCERDEVIDFMSRKVEECGEEDFAEKEVEVEVGGDYGRGNYGCRGNPVPDVYLYEKSASFEEAAVLYSEHHGFRGDFLLSNSYQVTNSLSLSISLTFFTLTLPVSHLQDFQYESMGPIYPPKTFIAR